MEYSKLADFYEKLEKTTKRLEKTFIVSQILVQTPEGDLQDVIYLLQGKVFPDWDDKKIGVSSKLLVRAISKATGASAQNVEKMWARKGGLGLVAEDLVANKKHRTLTGFGKSLTIRKVLENITALAGMEGMGTVDRKVNLVVELLAAATPSEAKYIVRTILEELRTGVGEGVLRDALVWSYLPKVIGVFFKCEQCGTLNPKTTKCLNCGAKMESKFKKEAEKDYAGMKVLKAEGTDDLEKLNDHEIIITWDEKAARSIYDYFIDSTQHAYDMATDFAFVAKAMRAKGLRGLADIWIMPGKPLKLMLYPKAKDFAEAMGALGTPLIAEPKYDGFRMQIHKTRNGKVRLFTRRLEDVTKQFPDVVESVKKNVSANNFILDAEIMGMNPETGRFMPFQYMSQRIKRKHGIEKMVKDLPAVIKVFDVIVLNGESLLNMPLNERKKRLKAILKQKKNSLEMIEELVSDDENKLRKFYDESLAAGNEGVMLKKLDGVYKPGRRVGYGMKIKPVLETLDLVIVGAEWGEGKRAKWLSSFTLACRGKDGFLEIGKVGTGIKEKGEEGVSFSELTKLLNPNIIGNDKRKMVEVKPTVVVEVNYEEIQKSPKYGSGYALRFPRVIRMRDDKDVSEINTLGDVERIYRHQRK